MDSSLSSTPVLESSLSASLASESSLLQRTLSSLSLSSDDVGGQVAALQHGGRHPVPPHHAALLAASAAGWPLAGDASLQALLAGAQAGPLAAGLHSMLVTDAAMAAVLAQHQLALMRVGCRGCHDALLYRCIAWQQHGPLWSRCGPVDALRCASSNLALAWRFLLLSDVFLFHLLLCSLKRPTPAHCWRQPPALTPPPPCWLRRRALVSRYSRFL